MGLSVRRETSKKLTVYRVCYTAIETLSYVYKDHSDLNWILIWVVTSGLLVLHIIRYLLPFCLELLQEIKISNEQINRQILSLLDIFHPCSHGISSLPETERDPGNEVRNIFFRIPFFCMCRCRNLVLSGFRSCRFFFKRVATLQFFNIYRDLILATKSVILLTA